MHILPGYSRIFMYIVIDRRCIRVFPASLEQCGSSTSFENCSDTDKTITITEIFTPSPQFVDMRLVRSSVDGNVSNSNCAVTEYYKRA